MPDTKLTALPDASTTDGTEYVYISQGGVSRRVLLSYLSDADFIRTDDGTSVQVELDRRAYTFDTIALLNATTIPSDVNQVWVRDLSFIRSATAATTTSNSGAIHWLADGRITVKHFGCVEGGSTDNAVGLQAALDSHLPVILPAGFWATTAELQWSDGSSLVGVGPFWKVRSGYVADGLSQSIIKYTGAVGTNTTVCRVADVAVGIEGTDFAPPDTSDLRSYRADNFHIDANGADIGLYSYRAGNQTSMDNITVEGATKANIMILGAFAARFGTLGVYEGVDAGAIIGVDYFGWGDDYFCFEFSATIHAVNNGTGGVYVKGRTTASDRLKDETGCGVIANAGRGSVITITSEGNDGRAAVLSARPSGGPVEFAVKYMEACGDGVLIKGHNDSTGMKVSAGFHHPGNGTLPQQDITIEAQNSSGTPTAGDGPTDPNYWPVIEGVIATDASMPDPLDVNSNTNKYRVINCSSNITFSDEWPSYNEGQGDLGTEILNGGFRNWQRGTSFSANGWTADRWYLNLSGATGALTQQTTTLGDIDAEPELYAQLDVTVANADAEFYYVQEGVRAFAGQTAVLSFWAKSDTEKTYRLAATQDFGSGGSADVSTVKDITIGTTWKRYTTEIDIPSISGKTIGADNFIRFRFIQQSAVTFTLSLACFQIDRGYRSAAQYRWPDVGSELSQCMRYYQRVVDGNGIMTGVSGYAIAATSTIHQVQFVPPMRATPTMEISSASTDFEVTSSSGAGVAITGLALSQANEFSGRLVGSGATGLTSGQGTGLRSKTVNAELSFTAELF